MEIHTGHVFYIAGSLITLFSSLILLLSKNIEYIIEGLCDKPRQARIFWGVLGLCFFFYLVVSLLFNWSKVSIFGRIVL